MKKLMLAASAAALSAVTLADVYSVKFTAKTPVDVANTKGQTTTSMKSIVVQGLWDVEAGKYVFWTQNGKVYAPIKNATFALVQQYGFLTKDVEDKAKVAEEYELLWGRKRLG